MEDFLNGMSCTRERSVCIALALIVSEAYSGRHVTGVKKAMCALSKASNLIIYNSRKEENLNDKRNQIKDFVKSELAKGTPKRNLASKVARRFKMSSRWAREIINSSDILH